MKRQMMIAALGLGLVLTSHAPKAQAQNYGYDIVDVSIDHTFAPSHTLFPGINDSHANYSVLEGTSANSADQYGKANPAYNRQSLNRFVGPDGNPYTTIKTSYTETHQWCNNGVPAGVGPDYERIYQSSYVGQSTIMGDPINVGAAGTVKISSTTDSISHTDGVDNSISNSIWIDQIPHDGEDMFDMNIKIELTATDPPHAKRENGAPGFAELQHQAISGLATFVP
jgi:hypothetical protein